MILSASYCMNKNMEKCQSPKRHYAKITESVFLFQQAFLLLFGFPTLQNSPSTASRRLFYRCLKVVGISYIIFGWCVYTFETITIGGHLASRTVSRLTFVLSYFPAFGISLRGLLVLTIFVFKRNHWGPLFYAANAFINKGNYIKDVRSYKKRLKRLAVATGVIAVSFHILRHIYAECHRRIFHCSPAAMVINNITVGEPVNGSSVATLKMDSFQCYTQVALLELGVTMPFIISQQIYIILGMLAKFVGDRTKLLNKRIEQERLEVESLCIVNKTSRQRHFLEIHIYRRKHALEMLLEDQGRIVEFFKRVNKEFLLIFTAAYCLDVLVMLGFVVVFYAQVLKIGVFEFMNTAISLTGIIIFALYVGAIGVPLVYVYEMGQDTIRKLSDYERSVLPITQTLQGFGLSSVLSTFKSLCIQDAMVFEVSDLFHVTRRSIVGSFTLILTIALIANEIFKT